jgi:hypothetical protein
MNNLITQEEFNRFLIWCSQHNLIGSVTLTHCNGGFVTLVDVDCAGSITQITNFGGADNPCKTFNDAFEKLKIIEEATNPRRHYPPSL